MEKKSSPAEVAGSCLFLVVCLMATVAAGTFAVVFVLQAMGVI